MAENALRSGATRFEHVDSETDGGETTVIYTADGTMTEVHELDSTTRNSNQEQGVDDGNECTHGYQPSPYQ